MNSLEATVRIDLPTLVASARRIADLTKVKVMAVVKADAYGLGAPAVAAALADHVQGFCVFHPHEAAEAGLMGLNRPIIALGPPDRAWGESDYKRIGVRPAVSNVQSAKSLAGADPILSVDTGMQRFAARPEEIDQILSLAGCSEAFTHAIHLEQVTLFKQIVGGRGLMLHAAATALLGEPTAWLDAVRPGLALYEGAVRVTAPLLEVRESRGPIGYTGFTAGRHGVIGVGYSRGLRRGPCRINHQPGLVVEVGMQTAYVDLTEFPKAEVGDDVTLLGDGLSSAEVAGVWGCSPQEAMHRLARCGRRLYVP